MADAEELIVSRDQRYVTVRLVRLDVGAASVAYASAGHIPGTLLDGPDGSDWVMESTGVPLGLFAESVAV